MKDDPHVGCGIWPLLITKTKFVDACEWHDLAYLKNSWHQGKLPRAVIDRWFRDQMLRASGGFRDRLTAWTFYGLARLFGGLFWEAKEDPKKS